MNWLTLPSIEKLQEMALKLNVPLGAATPWGMVIRILEKMSDADIAKSPIFKDFYIFRRQFTDEEIREKRAEKKLVPKSFVCHRLYVPNMNRWFNSHPDDYETAFSGFVMGSPAEQIQFTFDKRFTCICGEELLMEKTVQEVEIDPLTRTHVVKKEWQVDIGSLDCPTCKKMWRWLKLEPNPTGTAGEEVNKQGLST